MFVVVILVIIATLFVFACTLRTYGLLSLLLLLFDWLLPMLLIYIMIVDLEFMLVDFILAVVSVHVDCGCRFLLLLLLLELLLILVFLCEKKIKIFLEHKTLKTQSTLILWN